MTAFLSKLSSKQSFRYEKDALPTKFVAWPSGEMGYALQDIEIDLPVDKLVIALFGRQAAVGVRHRRCK